MSLISLKEELNEREANRSSTTNPSGLTLPKKEVYALVVAIIGGLLAIYLNTGKVGFSDFVGMLIATALVATLYFGFISIGSIIRPSR